MTAALFDIEALLAPLGDEAPCGPELDFDPDFQALERAGAGTPERQYGDKVFPAEAPDWVQVYELAQGLAQRTRDVRLAVWLTRSAARLHGMPGATRGLQLLQGLLEQHWAHVHPQLDASDNNDPTMRLNALAPLAAGDAVPADLRAAGIVAGRGVLTLRELELGLGKAEPHGDEARPSEAGVLEGLASIIAAKPEAADTLAGAGAAAQAVVNAVESQVGSAAPDLSPLTRLLAMGTQALARLAPGDGDSAQDGNDNGQGSAAGSGTGSGSGGGIKSRADAARELERVCNWLEQHEPGHPAPLLIRRAQRLLNMTFIEIMHDLAPLGVDQVQTIAGPRPE